MALELVSIDLLWRGALAVIPLAIVVAIVCWWMPCRPSTRHTLWLIVLGFFAAAPFMPRMPIPQFASLSFTASDAEVAPQSLPSSRTLRSPGVDAGRRPSMRPADVLPEGLPTTAPVRAVAVRPDGALESKTAFVESDRSTAPGNPRVGKSVLPATATKSRMPHIPGVAPSVEPKPGPSSASKTGGGMPDRNEQAVSRAHPLPVELGRWIQYATGVRDAVMGLPPIPALVWIGGIVLLLIVAGLRIGRSVQLVRAATPAPPSVVNMVAAASTHLALRRSPLTLMTDRAISPMLWCGRHVYLILPRQLWEQLDEVGRQAVVYHELAHLRRRDHWVCWAELIIGGLYWWNPVVWFVRLRLREEADLCCDAWVTALLPTGRRAYAQALLDTRKHTSVTQPAMPCVGLGVTTKRTKRFARRLTMVMTEHVRPRLSIRGLALACALAVGGFIVTPLWACPPSERAPQPPKPMKLRAVQLPSAPRPPAETQPDRDQTTFEQFMRGRDGRSLQRRLDELERQLDRLQKELEQRSRSGVRDRRAPQDRSRTRVEDRPAPGPKTWVPKSGATLGRIGVPSVDVRIQVPDLKFPRGLVLAAPLTPPTPPSPLAITAAPLARLRLAEALQSAAIAGGGDACCEKVVTKTYKLSKGKLDAMTELMRRDDVPILIRPRDDGIEVYGNQAQHMIFGAFVKMIDGEDQVQLYQLSEGKLGALTELMARNDVPIIIEPGDDSITVHGNDLEQAIFKAFVNMISETKKVTQVTEPSEPGAAPSYRSWAQLAEQYENLATEVYRDSVTKWAEIAEQYEGQAGKWLYNKQVEALLKAVEDQVSKVTEQAARMAAQSLRAQEWAEALSEKAEQIEEAASELEDDDDRGRLLRKIQQIMRQVEAMLRQAESLQDEADTAENQADALRDHADEIREVIEEIHETEVVSRGR